MKVGRILSNAIHGLDVIDIEILLANVLDVNRATLKAYPERTLSLHEQEKFNALLQRRIDGEPIAYLVGHKEFWSLDFLVTKDVLIPRPDTELLVEIALEQLEACKNRDLRILDLGTGCGAIALSIAKERPDVHVVATDASADALHIAKLNAKHFHLENVEFALGNWFTAIANYTPPKFDMILSNPPYVAALDPHLLQGDLRFEPNKALVGGQAGMDDLCKIISQAPGYLVDGGLLLVEHGYDQAQLVTNEFIAAGFTDIVACKDLAGNLRVTYARKIK